MASGVTTQQIVTSAGAATTPFSIQKATLVPASTNPAQAQTVPKSVIQSTAEATAATPTRPNVQIRQQVRKNGARHVVVLDGQGGILP